MLAFVLSRQDWREQDQIVTLFTDEQGKVEALARGIKKIVSKNSAYLLPFFLIEVELLDSKELKNFTKAVPVETYKNIAENLNKMIVTQTILAWTKSLTVYEKDLQIFWLMQKWFVWVNGLEVADKKLAYIFLGNILVCLGVAPELSSCVLCGDEKVTALSVSHGGLICKNCYLIKKEEKNYPLTKKDLEAFRNLFGQDWEVAALQNTEVANRLLFFYAQYHAGQKLAKISQI